MRKIETQLQWPFQKGRIIDNIRETNTLQEYNLVDENTSTRIDSMIDNIKYKPDQQEVQACTK